MSKRAATFGSSQEEEKKRKKILSNRESARRSRIRKRQLLQELVNEVAELKTENRKIAMESDALAERYFRVESENKVLRLEVAALAERLESLNSVLQFDGEYGCGVGVQIPAMQPVVGAEDFGFWNFGEVWQW